MIHIDPFISFRLFINCKTILVSTHTLMYIHSNVIVKNIYYYLILWSQLKYWTSVHPIRRCKLSPICLNNMNSVFKGTVNTEWQANIRYSDIIFTQLEWSTDLVFNKHYDFSTEYYKILNNALEWCALRIDVWACGESYELFVAL